MSIFQAESRAEMKPEWQEEQHSKGQEQGLQSWQSVCTWIPLQKALVSC